MRQFDLIQAPAPLAIGVGLSLVTINGPQYIMQAQSDILRFLFCHGHFELVSIDPNNGALFCADAWMALILNPNSGADKHIRVPIRKPGLEIAVGGFDGGGMGIGSPGPFTAGPPATWTHDFDLANCDIRGDDFPNLGGVQIAQSGTGAFSVAVKFNYVFFTFGGGATFNYFFDVLADLTDVSQIPFKR
jgi:hypothetical protein